MSKLLIEQALINGINTGNLQFHGIQLNPTRALYPQVGRGKVSVTDIDVSISSDPVE